MQVNCNHCKDDFTVTLQTRRITTEGAVDLHFFKCPHCNEEYPSGYTNTDIRSMQSSVSRLREKFSRTKDDAKRDAMKLEINRIQSKISKDMDDLKALIQEKSNQVTE